MAEHDRMYDCIRWRKARARFLNANPLCVMCEQRRGMIVPATIVDHVIEHKGDYELFWDQNNWQALCATCHSGVKRVQDHHGYSQSCGVDGLPSDPQHPFNRGKA